MKDQSNHARCHVGLILIFIGLIIAVALAQPGHVMGQASASSWSFTGNLNAFRRGQTATLLHNGKVLVAGGYFDVDALNDTRTAELYDPATGRWTSTGSLNVGRYDHTATLLPDGRVLVAGGTDCPKCGGPQTSSELYDPSTGGWSKTGSLKIARSEHTATLLPDGKVLVAGGGVPSITAANSAEVYDPAIGTWTSNGSLYVGRYNHTASLLATGKVLVAGGVNNCSNSHCSFLNSAELYDPATGTWVITGSLNAGRAIYTATLLRDGKVLAVGGYTDYLESVLETSELYDPATGSWTNTGSLNEARGFHTATLLLNGKVLVAAGESNGRGEIKGAELFDPSSGVWTRTADLNEARDSHSAILLPNGKVLVAAGGVAFTGSHTAELYDPGSDSNQIDDVTFFVRQHYRDFLNRESDPDGLAFWINEITSCGGDAQCAEVKRINVSASFFLSIEFQQTGYLVYRLYKASYGNLPGGPVPLARSEFLPDTQQIGQGVIVNQAGWEQVLENNKQTLVSQFVQRSRFTSAYPTSMAPEAFVDNLFTNAGVTPSSDERAAAINEFGAVTNTADVSARARALRSVAENPLLAQQEFNRAFVLMQYLGYLQRNPNDAPDGNFDGYNFWLSKLNQFNGNFVQAEMVKAFISSSEYRRRFGP